MIAARQRLDHLDNAVETVVRHLELAAVVAARAQHVPHRVVGVADRALRHRLTDQPVQLVVDVPDRLTARVHRLDQIARRVVARRLGVAQGIRHAGESRVAVVAEARAVAVRVRHLTEQVRRAPRHVAVVRHVVQRVLDLRQIARRVVSVLRRVAQRVLALGDSTQRVGGRGRVAQRVRRARQRPVGAVVRVVRRQVQRVRDARRVTISVVAHVRRMAQRVGERGQVPRSVVAVVGGVAQRIARLERAVIGELVGRPRPRPRGPSCRSRCPSCRTRTASSD